MIGGLIQILQIHHQLCSYLEEGTGFANEEGSVRFLIVFLLQNGVQVVVVDPVISTSADDVERILDDIVSLLRAN